jgi:hypothetical protein
LADLPTYLSLSPPEIHGCRGETIRVFYAKAFLVGNFRLCPIPINPEFALSLLNLGSTSRAWPILAEIDIRER